MMPLGIALETGTTGLWYGRFIDFLGTHARANSREGVLSELELELNFHLIWLYRHGEEIPEIDDLHLDVVEEMSNVNELGDSGGEVALFQYDKRNVTMERLDEIITLMTHYRNDLLKLIKPVDHEIMQIVPTTKTRSISDILHHICNAEEWYISRMGSDAQALYESIDNSLERDNLPIRERLSCVREACVHTLRDVVPTLGANTFTRSEYTSYPEEEWTAHKVLRRFLEHEREHYYNIRGYLKIPVRPMSYL